MASKSGVVWAIDIGNNSLKALRLSAETGDAEVVGFDNIQHAKILTGSGVTPAERDELVALSLRQFIEQNNLGKEDIVVSMPSQNSFARFVTLPPVEQKRIPEIVKFEAAQQIPFDINDVQWDWQLMTPESDSDKKVGIFAIKSDVVNSTLDYFSAENVKVTCVQMAPMALYNCVLYDRSELADSENQAVVLLDIGAESTDLVVCTTASVWQRCIPIGGNAFTRAIADAFKLNFQKAEKLKRTAPMSKYARQIFQAMRPVFTDLVSEIQRSLNFYGNSNPNTKVVRVIAAGGGTKMRGLLKYLRQTLQLPVERLDSFKKLALGEGVSAAKFHEHVSDFAIVYGLGLQGLGLAQIESNLLPRNIARSMAWADKARYFTAAASILLLVALMAFARTSLDRIKYDRNAPVRGQISSIIGDGRDAQSKLDEQVSRGRPAQEKIKKAFEPFSYRQVVPELYQLIVSALPNKENNQEQAELYDAFMSGDVATIKEHWPRKKRKQIFLTSVSARFVDDVNSAELGESALISGDSMEAKDGMAEDEDELEYLDMIMRSGRPLPKYMKGFGAAARAAGPAEQPGFVVTIQGYSPYENVGQLLDPLGVEGQLKKWGFVTRLQHQDPNGTFELFKKTEKKHFEPRIGEVDLAPDKELPQGIGVVEIREVPWDQSGEKVLVDAMTNEIISKVVQRNEEGNRKINRRGKFVYTVNDHWFELKLKFVWKKAPPKPVDPAATPMGVPGRGY
ncbi:MAG: type IV pilus assembly protein PilM [Planctomycetota bacterium]|jgi:type IV pilus assembly protein PilM